MIGLLVAVVIMGLWMASLGFLLPIADLTVLSPVGLGSAILGRTFLQTGLFIVAHDAMHRSLVPQQRWLNDGLGRLALWLYAFLSYQRCRCNHGHHHSHPAQVGDPDFHDGVHRHPIRWYIKFLQEYLSLTQLTVFLSGWIVISLGLNQLWAVPFSHIVLFWGVPLILSSVQLFWFGTYLPHRGSFHQDPHRARSMDYPVLWSFLTCYHFGYHWEHHEFPQVPWYELPKIHTQSMQLQYATPVCNPKSINQKSMSYGNANE